MDVPAASSLEAVNVLLLALRTYGIHHRKLQVLGEKMEMKSMCSEINNNHRKERGS